MTNAEFALLIVEPDPMVRLGLKTLIEAESSLQLWSVEARLADVWRELNRRDAATQGIILLLASLDARYPDVDLNPLQLQRLKERYPTLKIWLLARSPQELQDWLPQPTWLDGCSWQDFEPSELLTKLQSLAQGERLQPQVQGAIKTSRRRASWWQRQCWSGIQQVDRRLWRLRQQLQSSSLRMSWLERQILSGQSRELRTARWLLVQGLGFGSNQPIMPLSSADGSSEERPIAVPASARVSPPSPNSSRSEAAQISPENLQALQPLLSDRIVQKLGGSLLNLTTIPLEIDILKTTKKQELLAIILRCYETILLDLRQAQLSESQLLAQTDQILQDLWTQTLSDYFGRYTRLVVNQETVDVIPKLLGEWTLVQDSIIGRIPGITTLLQTHVFGQPMTINGQMYEVGSEEAMEYLQQLTENLLLQTANAVLQPFLNYFADIEVIKQSFYDQRLLSTREIERFRNNLSWKYRFANYVRDARDVYESRHWLLTLTPAGIRSISIYAPRRQEFESLSGLQQSITLGLEFRDAIAPRLQALTSWVGSGVVYVLTKVVGRGLGLIGRGILQSLNSSWGDLNLRRKPER